MTTATKRSVCTVDGCPEPSIGRGWCQTHYYRWKRTGSTDTTDKRYLLDADTLAALRQKVGLPEDGPTPEMVKSWCAVEGIDDEEQSDPSEPDEPQPEPEPVDVEQQLRTEVQHVREAFDILLRERDQLARQVTESEEPDAQVAALERELKLVRSERGALQRARDAARADRDRMAAKLDTEQHQRVNLAQQLFDAHSDRHRLAGLLEEATDRIDEMQRQVEDVIATADQLTAATAELTRHRHAWEWQPGLKAMPLPCACGKPWPRNRPIDTERARPRVELLKPPNTSAEPTGDNDHEGQ